MKRSALVLLALAMLAGCGGDDSDDDRGSQAAPSDAPDQPAIEGERTPAKIAKALDLQPAGSGYTYGEGCKVTGIAGDKAAVSALIKEQGKTGTYQNESGTAAIHIAKVTYGCAIVGKLKIINVP